MEDGFSLAEARIGIIGLGLMGGSLALALQGKCAALYGMDADPATLELARARKLVDRAESDPAKLISQADLVILATPVPIIIDVLRKLPGLNQTACVVLDLGSTKTEILRAMAALPEQFEPIGGHPICGKEKLGLEHADGHLFANAAFVLTPLPRTTLRARRAAEQIISVIGARKIEMNAEEHDRILALTSHLPFLLASALALSTPQEFAPLTGTGFKSTSRLAGTPSSLMLGVLESNRENILDALAGFQKQLSEIQCALRGNNFVSLENILGQSQAAYRELVER
jgi:prephenate dehydrogenase